MIALPRGDYFLLIQACKWSSTRRTFMLNMKVAEGQLKGVLLKTIFQFGVSDDLNDVYTKALQALSHQFELFFHAVIKETFEEAYFGWLKDQLTGEIFKANGVYTVEPAPVGSRIEVCFDLVPDKVE